VRKPGSSRRNHSPRRFENSASPAFSNRWRTSARAELSPCVVGAPCFPARACKAFSVRRVGQFVRNALRATSCSSGNVSTTAIHRRKIDWGQDWFTSAEFVWLILRTLPSAQPCHFHQNAEFKENSGLLGLSEAQLLSLESTIKRISKQSRQCGMYRFFGELCIFLREGIDAKRPFEDDRHFTWAGMASSE